MQEIRNYLLFARLRGRGINVNKMSQKSVFRAYDIRGLSPGELDSAFAERLGRVIVNHFKCKNVMIGRDMRMNSPELEGALTRGITASGANVTSIGMCSTPMFNISMGLAKGKYDFGVMVTASHNPSQYNGFKMTNGDVYPIGEGSGMEEIRDAFVSKKKFADAPLSGAVREDTGALKAYLDHIMSFVDVRKFGKMKIAVDAGNGMNGYVMQEFARRLPQIQILPLYWEPDGRFPNHEANPLNIETLHDLRELVKKKKCDFGVAFDGDGDRVGFVDELGEPIDGSFLTAIFAQALLKDHPGSLILHDLRSSWSTAEEIKRAGGKSEMTRVGHAFIKRQIREHNGLFGGEVSMHFYFGDLWGVESGDLCLLLMLKLLTGEKKKLSQIWKPMKRYAYSGEINSEVKDKDEVLKRIDKTYTKQASSIVTIDGVRMEFTDQWWFSVRASNTEPLMRLIVEATTTELMEQKRDELLAIIRQ